MDLAGPFQGQTYLVTVDLNSKWLEVSQVASVTTAVRVLRKLFAMHGLLDNLLSDNRMAFTSGEFQEFVSKNRIRNKRSEPSIQLPTARQSVRLG